MTQAMDNLRDCKKRSQALEERLARWQEKYREYQCLLAEFRVRQQEFDFLMATRTLRLYTRTHPGSPVQ